MASGCPLSWTDLRDRERVRVVASRAGRRRQPQPPPSHLPGVEPVLAVGLQQVLVDDLIPQRPRQLDFLPGAMQIDDVKGDGAPDIVVAAKGRAGAEGSAGGVPREHRLQDGVWGALQGLALCSHPGGTLPSRLPLCREMPPPHHEAWLREDAFPASLSSARGGTAQGGGGPRAAPLPRPCKEEAENGGKLSA